MVILDEVKKNVVLKGMVVVICENKDKIKDVNEKEVVCVRENNFDDVMIDCFIFDDECIEFMVEGIEVIISLDDFVGKEWVIGICFNGIEIKKMCILLGVVCMIYEVCFNVIVDVGVLCFKLGNVVILCGGKEVLDISLVIVMLM